MRKLGEISLFFKGIAIKLFILFALLSVFLGVGCKHDTNLNALLEIKFSEVPGIISCSCGSTNCHGDNAEEFSLIGYDNIKKVYTWIEQGVKNN